MDHTEPTNQTTNALDSATKLMLTDPEVQNLYDNGHIGRPMAEVFDIIAGFNDDSQGEASYAA